MQYFSVQRLAYLAILLTLLTYILHIGINILQPLAFAGLFMLISLPVVHFYEKKLSTIPSIVLSFVTILVPIFIILIVLSQYLMNVMEDLPSISERISKGVEQLFSTVSRKVGVTKTELKTQVGDNAEALISAPASVIKSSISFSTDLLANTFLTFIYTFLLLLYRHSIKQFLMSQFTEGAKDMGKKLFSEIRNVSQSYLYGMGIVMLILGTLNSLGLLLIGIEYAFLWGFLAALLAVIPYVGTLVGGMLPFLYAFATTGTLWQPMAVIALFMIVQTIEGNLITPKIVGSSVELNPLAAILSLVLGNALWGIGGMILAIPFMAITRVIFTHIEPLRPISLLLSSKLYDKEEVFSEKYDKKRFRLVNLFKVKRR